MTVLLLGGTGAIGDEVSRALVQRGMPCFVTSRTVRPEKSGIRFLVGDAMDSTFLRSLLSQRPWDAIIDFMVYPTATFESRVETLLGATKQYLYLRPARVFAEVDGPIVEESPRLLNHCDDPNYLATDEYALAKARQEDILTS